MAQIVLSKRSIKHEAIKNIPVFSPKTRTFVKEETKVEIESHNLVKQEAGPSSGVVSNSDQSSSEDESHNVEDIVKLLVKEEIDSDVEGNYELSPSDIEKEFEVFNKEDEKINSGKTTLENNTTAYKCQMCQKLFTKLPEYKAHKKAHFIEKRRYITTFFFLVVNFLHTYNIML